MVSGSRVAWGYVLWLSLCLIGAIVLLFALINSETEAAFFGISVASAVLCAAVGVVAFVADGRERITALGLFNYSTALFVGFGGVYVALSKSIDVSTRYLALAILCALIPQVLVSFFARYRGDSISVLLPPVRDSRLIATWGGIALGVLTVIRLLGAGEAEDGFVEAAAFTAITIFAVGILWTPKAKIISVNSLLVAASFVLYSEVFHQGAGRLRVIALACTLGILFTARFRNRSLKYLVMGATPVALYWLAQSRLTFQESLNAGASLGRTGLESMLNPIIVFSDLLRAQFENGFPLSYGFNLLSFPASLLPSEWVPGAPQALGYELVKVYSPDRYGSGYSVVATNAGEAVYNFGLFGLLLMIPVLVWLMRFLDKRFVASLTASRIGSMVLLGIVFWSMTAGAISDLTWSGQHTFLARWALRLPLLVLIAVVVRIGVAMRAKHVSDTSPLTGRALQVKRVHG